MAAIENAGSITGEQKAAILMLALGEASRSKLFTLLQENEIRSLSAAMMQLGAVGASVVDQVCAEFRNNLGGPGTLVGGLETTERMLRASLPTDRATQLLDELRGPAGDTMWEKLALLWRFSIECDWPMSAAVWTA